MMYAIQNNEVRWFLTLDEEEHLFSLFDLSDVIAEIVVHGNWNEYLTFKPIVYKSRREPNTIKGSYTVLPLRGPDNETIKTISVPIEHLKLSHTNKTLCPATATVLCTPAPIGRELLVYPTQLLDSPQNSQSEQSTDQRENEPIVETYSSTSTELVETAQTPPDTVSDPNVMPLSEHAAWAKEVVTEINSILDLNQEISVTVAEGGRSVKFLRKVLSRRTIT